MTKNALEKSPSAGTKEAEIHRTVYDFSLGTQCPVWKKYHTIYERK